MKKCLVLFGAALLCFSMIACGNAQEDTAPPVTVADIAAEPATAVIAPADVDQLSTSSQEPFLQPMGEAPGEMAPVPAEPSEDAPLPEESQTEE